MKAFSGDTQAHTVHFRHLHAEEAQGEERRGSEGEAVDPGRAVRSSPGLLVGAQTAHGTVAGAAADTRVGGREAADRTEGALGPGRGSRTGRQVVGALGHTQVLLRQGEGCTAPRPPT